MKKILTAIIITLLLVGGSVQAQNQDGLFSLGASINYGSKNKLIGFGARAQYGFTDRIRGSAEYKYYLDRRNWSEWQINMDAHYMIGLSTGVSFYPIVGARLSRWTVDTARGHGVSEQDRYKKSNTRIGANLGAGFQVQLSYNFFLQLEPKYEISRHYSQFSGMVGIMFQF